MTYLKPKKWYWKPLIWTARCQRKSIYDQFFKYGVRMFDIRVRFTKTGDITFAHGPIEFKGDVHLTMSLLNSYAESVDTPVYCRVMLESNSEMKDQSLQDEHFSYFCENLEEDYPIIKFFGGNRKYDGKVIYHFKTKYPSIEGKYSSVVGSKIDDIYPYLYAKLYNKKNIQNSTTRDILLIDFVDIR